MISLRPYQEKAITAVRQSFAQGIKKLILCAPTGAGKTIMFSYIAAQSIKRGNKVMIVCDRKELIQQSKEKLNTLGLYPTIIAPGFKMIPNSCYLASVDTLIRRDLPEVDIIIIDEAHKQTFDKICHQYSDKYLIGATATPLRTGNQKALSQIYQQIIQPVTISSLIEDKWLVPPRYFAAKIDLSDVKTLGGDYENGALFQKFDKPKLYAGVIDKWKNFAHGKKTICFNVNVEHSKKMVQEFNENGISAVHLDGGTPALERKLILKDFAEGKFQVLSNCSVLTTGFDEPSLECVIINRATLSVALWLQMLGRGGRSHPSKEEFIIIDMGANIYKHGFWEEDREWSLEKPIKKKKAGAPPAKDCPKCQAVLFASAQKCKYCGHVFEQKEKKLIESDFIEVKKDTIRGAKSLSGIQDFHKIAKERGYNPGWAYIQSKVRGVK